MPRPVGTVVDPHHWLTDAGTIPPDGPVRGKAIRVAQCIEYAASLPAGHVRETLIPCRRRPDGEPCSGMLVVLKEDDDSIDAFCDTCNAPEFLIHDWQDTRWANGQPPDERLGAWADRRLDEAEAELGIAAPSKPAAAHQTSPPPPRTATQQAIARILADLHSPLSVRDLSIFIATAPSPTVVLQYVVSTVRDPSSPSVIDTLLPLVFELWNETPRPELGGVSPNEAHATAPLGKPARAEPKPGRNAPCPCGSGNKYERCCGSPTPHH